MQFNKYTHTHTHTQTVMYNLINTHTHTCNLINTHTHTHTCNLINTHTRKQREKRRCQTTRTPGDLMEGHRKDRLHIFQVTYRMCGLHAGQFDGGQGPRDCLYRFSTGTDTSRTTWRANNPGRNPAPFAVPKPHLSIQFIPSLCPREKNYQGTAASVTVHEREVYSGEGNNLLEKLGRPLLRTRQ